MHVSTQIFNSFLLPYNGNGKTQIKETRNFYVIKMITDMANNKIKSIRQVLEKKRSIRQGSYRLPTF